MELCRLRCRAVTGMSINYVKCFDLIPLAVMVALALELGMDPGNSRALRAMYEQLRWRVEGGLAAPGAPYGGPVDLGACAQTAGRLGPAVASRGAGYALAWHSRSLAGVPPVGRALALPLCGGPI